jgi:Protein of unknown function (DUF1236)
MQRSKLLASTAIALLMCSVPALAQQKSDDKAGAAQTQGGETKEQGASPKGANQKESREGEGKDKGAQRTEKQKTEKQRTEKESKGTAQAPAKDQDKKDRAQTEPQEKRSKGTAQTPSKDRGAAQAPTNEKDKKGSGQAQSKDRDGKDNAQKQSKDGDAQKSAERPGAGARAQLSEQQRSNVHQTILKERNLNRASNVNISISVGTRIPRSVRLVALPASIISVVPAYRSYRYVVVNEQICIVDPNTYEIVDVIALPGQTARVDGPAGQATLVLTEDEKVIVLRAIDMDRSSTLGLGTLTEGSSVPRGADVQSFPDTVVQQVPKLKGHKYFAAENRVAIVDPQGDKVQLVLEGKR